jgi:hypothetical protein
MNLSNNNLSTNNLSSNNNNINNSNNRKISSNKGIIIGYNKIPIDIKILNSLSNFDIDIEKTQNCL